MAAITIASSAIDSLHYRIFVLFVFLLPLLMPEGICAAPAFGFDIHHRFSDLVRQWADLGSRGLPGWWPEKGTAEYYTALVGHDRVLRGRVLAEVASEVAFADGNETIRINSLGFLHYALVSLGTPNVTFLVALDTGSNLFWVPCDCTSCAPTSSNSYGLGVDLNIYSPSSSTTSQNISCNSSLCASRHQYECSEVDGLCPYSVEYVSSQTSSSGFLVNDVLYLTTQDSNPQIIKAPVVIGCGKVQTGSFLGDAAPNGLFGLGMDKLSVPSILSSRGLISNSFSMCFGHDGLGRINFGDQGSSDQQQTSFNANQNSIYNISITGIEVGNSSSKVRFSALIDSGTSFTTLTDPAYTQLSENFNLEVKEKRADADSSIPFEYCYLLSSNASLSHLPSINFNTEGGSKFPVNYPVIFISSQEQRDFMFCLALVKSTVLSIIGQNFLTGLRTVFDRDKMILGWEKFNCYNVEDSNPLPVKPRNFSSLPPSPAVGPKGYEPEATKKPGNGTEVTILTPPNSRSSHLKRFVSIKLALFLLPVAIL